MSGTRYTYSDRFIDRFKFLFAKYQVDRDCYSILITEFGEQYPRLNIPMLRQIRAKRTQEFEEARRDFIQKVQNRTGEKDFENIVEARLVKDDLVRVLTNKSKRLLEKLEEEDLDEEDQNQILDRLMHIQEKLGKLSGLNNQVKFEVDRQWELEKLHLKNVRDLDKMRKQHGNLAQGYDVDEPLESLPRIVPSDNEDEDL